MLNLKYFFKENTALMISIDKIPISLILILILITLLNASCVAQKNTNNVIKIKGYKSFSFKVNEYKIIDDDLLKMLDDFLLSVDSCKNIILKNDRPPIYIQIDEFERGNSTRLGFTAKNSYSISFDLDKEMNSIVELSFKPTAMAKYKDYYVSFGSYLSNNKEYLSSKIKDTGKVLVYTGRALVDELGDWVLDDSKKVERVFEINEDYSLKWLFDLSCND